MRAVIRNIFFVRQDAEGIPTETLVCFLPGRANDLSMPLYMGVNLTAQQITRPNNARSYFHKKKKKIREN